MTSSPLTQLDHDEIRHINHVVDGPNARAFQPFLHPLRGRTDLHIFQNPRGKTRAKLRRINGDFHHILRLRLIVLFRGDLRPMRRFSGQNGNLPHNAEYAEAVAAVRGQLELQNAVVQPERFRRRLADLRIVGQDINAGFLLLRQVLRLHFQLVRRAEHAHRHDAAQLALRDLLSVRQMRANKRHGNYLPLLDVRRARHDRQRLFAAHVHRADLQMVGIRMRRNRCKLSRHDLVQPLVGTDDILHRNARHRQEVGKLFRRLVKINIVFQPLYRYLHIFFSLLKLAQEAQIVIIEQTQIVDAV